MKSTAIRAMIALQCVVGQQLMAQVAGCNADSASLHRIVADMHSRQQLVATSVAIGSSRGMLSIVLGYADRESGRPATARTRFRVASITKAFTGVALLQQARGGRLDLDAPIERYVSGFPVHPEKSVTARMLAAHVGGLRHWGPERNDALFARHIADVTEILELMRAVPYARPPGTAYSYSSYGYNVLAMAIQATAGRPFTEVVEGSILRPLGLRSVAFEDVRRSDATIASAYSWYDLRTFAELDSAPVRVGVRDYSHNMGGGNMVATAADLARFGLALRGPGLLDAEGFRLLWTRPVIAGVTSPSAAGLFVRPDTLPPRRLAASGSNPGVQAGLVVLGDHDLAIAVLTNTWGRGSRSGEFVDDGPRGFLGRLLAACLSGTQ